jgi:hypothetical protein
MKILEVATVFKSMAVAPIRIRGIPTTPPTASEHYEPTPLAVEPESVTTKARDVPIAETTPGGWGDWPPPVLTGFNESLAKHAADLRGVWQVHKGSPKGHVERVEQSGDRVVITAGGVIHDMFADTHFPVA